MAYDFSTDIDNLTRAASVAAPVKDWAVSWAKSLYIADDPANYDEDKSYVDNRLVSLLACGFVVSYVNGSDIAKSFQLDEFKIEFAEDFAAPEHKFLDMFWFWLRKYQESGVSLQYKESGSILTTGTYTEAIYVATRNLPEGIE